MDELERVDRIVRDLESVEAAWRTGYAMHKPGELAKEGREIRQRMKLSGLIADDVVRQQEQAGLQRLLKAHRMARRRRKG